MMAQTKDEQSLIWDFYKPRQTHAWNMVVLSWRAFEQMSPEAELSFETEYCWENFIIRLWLYRTTVSALMKIENVAGSAKQAIARFDATFETNGRNGLKALRDMIEHFDDYAAGRGRGPAQRDTDLDPFRSFTLECYERGNFRLERAKCLEAAI